MAGFFRQQKELHMLVLSRGPDESIRIGPDITITVVSIRGNSVRIGVEAPRETIIARTEVADGRTEREPKGGAE